MTVQDPSRLFNFQVGEVVIHPEVNRWMLENHCAYEVIDAILHHATEQADAPWDFVRSTHVVREREINITTAPDRTFSTVQFT